MKKLISLILTVTLVIGMTVAAGAATTTATATTEKKGYLVLGKDLNDTQQQKVLSLFQINKKDLSDYNVTYITNKDEHDALDEYISPSVIGKNALSSVLVKPTKKGSGITVTTHNINYCTPNMYKNALITAGVKDAEVIVAAPFAMSGTAALVGAIKAYEQMSGKSVDKKVMDASVNELVTESEIAKKVGNKEIAEELIAVLKLVVAANDFSDRKDVEKAIKKVTSLFDVKLSTQEFNNLVDLTLKLDSVGLQFPVLLEQASDIYSKYKAGIDKGLFDKKNANLSDEEIMKQVMEGLKGTLNLKNLDLSKLLKAF